MSVDERMEEALANLHADLQERLTDRFEDAKSMSKKRRIVNYAEAEQRRLRNKKSHPPK